MAKIEGIRIQNFRALKDVKLGKLWNEQQGQALTPMTVVIGKNGAGKSSLFDVFGFLADCLKNGVEEACDMNNRGGYERIHTKGTKGPIQFEIYFREVPAERPITYELAIDSDEEKRPYVSREKLRQRRRGQTHGRPFSFLYLKKGEGIVWKEDSVGRDIPEDDSFDLSALFDDIGRDTEESNNVERVALEDNRRLGIATLGALKQHPRISAFRKFMEGWYLSYFTPDAARSLPLAGPQKQLNIHGDNLSNVVQFMEREHKNSYLNVLQKIADKIPGIQKISTEKTADGRLLLQFFAKGFDNQPFFAQQMSDGTLKTFAYLLLIAAPNPAPLVCIEEPENGLYHKLLETLVQEFREYATGKRNSSQIFITTHQPYLVDHLQPEEVWILKKGDDGFSTVSRASSDPMIRNMVEEGLPLGSLWYSDYLDVK